MQTMVQTSSDRFTLNDSKTPPSERADGGVFHYGSYKMLKLPFPFQEFSSTWVQAAARLPTQKASISFEYP